MKSIKTIAITTALLSSAATVLADDATTNKAPRWESSAAAGLTLTRGNSETLLGTVDVVTGKKWDHNELSLGADGAYAQSKTDGKDHTTANSVHGFAQYNRLVNDRFYGYGRIEALHDEVADITYRFTFSPGVGYYFIKETRMDLSGEVGPGFIYEKTGSGTNVTEQTYATLRVGEKFNYKLSEHARIWQKAEFLPQVDDFNNYIINSELGIEADLTKSFSLRSFVQDSFDNQPAPGRKQNDLKWVTAVAYKF